MTDIKADENIDVSVQEEQEEQKVKKPVIKVRVRYDVFYAISLVYLALPVLIFFAFFLKLAWAIPFCVALVGALFLAIKDQRQSYSENQIALHSRENSTEIRLSVLIALGIISLFWAYICGIAEFAWGTADHTVRAAVLNDLVNYKWPVIYDMATQQNPLVSSSLPEGKATFAYYFTFWMVPAGVGKILGLLAARVCLVLWSALGLFLTMFGLCIYQKKASLVAPLFFMAFGGLDIIPYIVQSEYLHIPTTWEGWNYELWVHGNFYQTMNTFHQCIPGWLITLLLVDSRNNRHIGTVGALMFCYSPWATIGVLPIAIYELLAGKFKTNEKKLNVKNIFSVGNLLMPVIILAVFALFYTSNDNATAIKGFIWTFFDSSRLLIMVYLGYVVVEFGVWTLLVLKDNKKNPLFWVALITLLIFPIYKMSEANDLLMRGTLAPMMVIFMLSLNKLDAVIERFKGRGKNNDFKALGVFAVVFVMAMTPVFFLTTEIGATREIITGKDTGIQNKDKIVSFGNIVDEEYTEVTERQFYVFEYEDKPFYKLFGKF